MAESAIAYVAQNLTDLLVQKAEFLRGVGGQVEWLRDELQRMQYFLKDADAKQEEDERVHNWVTEIRSAAYDAEDIVDNFVLKIESWRRHGFVKRYAHIFKEIIDLRKVGKEIVDFQPSVKSRHHSVHSNFPRYFASEPTGPRLHSLLLFHNYELCYPTRWMKAPYLDFICANCKLLRVLDLENVCMGRLPRVIGKLIHLRYLCLKNSRLNKLPSSMRYLKSLQTLDISGNVFLHEIPYAICKMGNLRPLYMNASLCKGKLRINTLKNLHTPSFIQINNLKLESSPNLLNLRKLGVALGEDSDVNKFCNFIAELEQLESLQFISTIPSRPLPYLQGLSKVHRLTKLCLQGMINTL